MLIWVAALLLAAPIPPPLSALESSAEDLGDAAQHAQWSQAARLAERSRTALDELAGKADPRVLEAARNELDAASAALAAHDRWAAAFASNALSANVVRLYAPLSPVPPTDVMSLDVLLRRIQLDALTGRMGDAESAILDAQQAWRRLRGGPPIQGASFERVFDAELGRVSAYFQAKDARALAKAAGQALEGVDGLERVYLNKR